MASDLILLVGRQLREVAEKLYQDHKVLVGVAFDFCRGMRAARILGATVLLP